MASTIFHFTNQLIQNSVCHLFEGTDGILDGEQKRDFIHVDDVSKVVSWFIKKPEISGIYNLGTGNARTFNDVATSLIQNLGGHGEIKYVEFPNHLRGRYQNYTQASLKNLRKAGYEHAFMTLEDGIFKYLNQLPGVTCKEIED